MKSILTILLVIMTLEAKAQLNPIESGVYRWEDHPVVIGEDRESRKILEGVSPHFDYFEIHATSQMAGAKPSNAHANDDIEEVIIVKEGKMEVTIEGETKIVGPKSVVLLMPKQMHSLKNVGKTPLTYFVLRYRSKKAMDINRGMAAGGSLMINADSLVYRTSSRGGGVPYFDRATTMCERYEMHVTHLSNKGKSHDPHAHEETEIIMVISGQTEMTIAGKEYTAGPGDFYIMLANEPHGVRNATNNMCSYFAFKWK